MSATRQRDDEIERLVDRHIELCELFDGRRSALRREAPLLITMNEGKATIDCIADLVDRALVAYEGAGFAQDQTIYSLKVALVNAIEDMV